LITSQTIQVILKTIYWTRINNTLNLFFCQFCAPRI